MPPGSCRGANLTFVDRHWYRLSWLSVLLLPAAGVFGAVVLLRRMLYASGLLPSARLPVPVVVVGNIVAGGTGKTPLVLWLCDFLSRRGFQPGIVSRGYGGSGETMAVQGNSAHSAGDEPALLASRSGCPVWVGRDRTVAARALLAENPACDLVICDDGLQHYGLRRDFEIAVVDAARGQGNGLLIPSGPLREPSSRLKSVDAVVVTGATAGDAAANTFAMSLEGGTLRNLADPALRVDAGKLRGSHIHAIAGIGNPARFFDHLRRLGMSFTAHAFPDHYRYSPADLEFAGADAIVMTEKDAIKCRHFAREIHWELPVDARVDEALCNRLLDKLKARNGS